MLGNIAKKLRLLGFDSLFFSNIDDEELLKIAKSESRILITKDEQLSNISKKRQVAFIRITANDEVEQVLQISKSIKLDQCKIDVNSARCSLCNGELRFIQKNNVTDKIAVGVLETNNEFWECMKCKKLYWEGTHIRNMQKFVSKLNDGF